MKLSSPLLSAAVSLISVQQAVARTWNLADSYTADDFYTGFTWETIDDPTGGVGNYIDLTTAQADGLTYITTGNSFVAWADNTTTIAAGTTSRGRNTFRLSSNAVYDGDHIVIINLNHMPVGCGTWPAIWEFGPDWPNSGEIDIVEGVNGETPNQSTLHTSSGCTMPTSRTETGTPTSYDCGDSLAGDVGCAVQSDSSDSFGANFNGIGGGFFAMQKNSTFVSVWFWPRDATDIPVGVLDGNDEVIPPNWGTPYAYFPSSTTCDLSSKLGEQNIIINLALCGSWAGEASVWSASGCSAYASTCADYVNANPSAFDEAYFDIQSILVYT